MFAQHCARAFVVAATIATLFSSPLRAQQAARRDSANRADSAARLTAVTVVAAPTDRSQPLGVLHLDVARLRLTPATSPYELLRHSAGLEVHQQGQGPGFASNASMRGFSSDHSTDLALWIDGVPINEPVNGHAEGYSDWTLLFPAAVRDIDVVRGPTSALFGNFALAGAVNVRTLERMRGTEVEGSAGSYGRVDGSILTGFDHGTRGGGVLGLRFQREDGFRPNARFGLLQGHARVLHDIAPGVTIDAGAELYGGNWRSAGFLGDEDFARGDYDVVSNPSDRGFKQRAQERVSLRVTRGQLLWRSTAYATQGVWQLFLTIPPEGGRFEGTGSQTEEEDHRWGAGLTSAVTWASVKGEVTVGIEERLDQSRYDNYFTTERLRDSLQIAVKGRQFGSALFVQSHAALAARLRVDAGARFDMLATRATPATGDAASAAHNVVSPKLGASFLVTPHLSAYGNVSRGFRSTDGVISDPTLAPISAWSYEGGAKLDVRGVRASAGIFRMDVSNEQTFNPATLESTNGGRSRRQGVEVDWRVPVRPWATLSGVWSLNDARYRSLTALAEEGDGEPAVLNGLRVYNTARYVGTSSLDVAPRGSRWQLRVSGNWVGPYSPFDEPGVVVGAYGLMQVAGVVHARAADVELGVRNVLDRRYPELVAGGLVSPGQPRSVYVTSRLRR